MHLRELPQTRRAQLYRKLLGVTYVMAISGMTLVLSGVMGDLMDVGFDTGRLDPKQAVVNMILLAGSGLMRWMSYRGNRRNLVPPAWGLVAITALAWVALLVNRFA
jgi:hypothetical protein